MKNLLLKLAQDIREVAYELEVFGVEKQAAANRLFEYEIDGVKFFMDKRFTNGIRLPIGKARYTKNYYIVSGALSKALDDEEK